MKKIYLSFIKYCKSWSKGELIYALFVVSTIIIISIITINEVDIFWFTLGIISAILGVIGTMSAAKKSTWNYLFGITHIILYGAAAFHSRLYGDFMLNYFFFIPTNIYGIYIWTKNRDDNEEVIPKKLSKSSSIIILIVCILSIISYAYLLDYFTNHIGGAAVWLDSTSTILSIVGMILMMKRYSAQWILWIIVNVVSVGMWVIAFIKGDMNAIPQIIMWSIYIINASWGYMNWKKMWIFSDDYKGIFKRFKSFK